MMRKIGIVGGAAWPSTLAYYRLLCLWSNAHFRRKGVAAPLPTPPMAIESLVVHETRKLRAPVGADDAAWAAYDRVIRDALLRLQGAGCAFAIIANNTMHSRLHALRAGLDMPILSILEVSAAAAKAAGARRALVLGTSVTMRSNAYAEALAAHGLVANPPLSDDEIDALQALIDTEFEAERATPEGYRALLALCAAHVPDPTETAVLLACTELPLAFPKHIASSVFRAEGFTFVNTAAAHARAALERALGEPLDREI